MKRQRARSLEEECLGPLRQGQRLDTTKTKTSSHTKQRPPKAQKAASHKFTQELPLHKCNSPSAKEHYPQIVHALQRKPFPLVSKIGPTGILQQLTHKPVTPVSKTGPTGFLQQLAPKTKNAQEMHKLPLDSWEGSRDVMQLFSTNISPPCCQCMNQGSNLKKDAT
jgi:hypothetical protein